MANQRDKKITIWSNTIVCNEENFIWFSLMSVINYVDKMIVWDSGSTDKTVDIIKEVFKLNPGKVIYKEVGNLDKYQFTEMRQKMLQESDSDWIIVLDGDEVWWNDSIKNLTQEIRKTGFKKDAIVIPFYNLVGDIYHIQDEKAGEYSLLGKKGNLTIKAINKSIPGLYVGGPYGSEGYYDLTGIPIQKYKEDKITFLNTPFLHFSHLIRTTASRNKKYKFDYGHRISEKLQLPEVFFLTKPDIVNNPWVKRNILYIAVSLLKYPLTFLWRKLKK